MGAVYLFARMSGPRKNIILSNVFIGNEHLYILMQEFISSVLIEINTLI